MAKFNTGDLVRCIEEALRSPDLYGRVGDVFRVEALRSPDLYGRVGDVFRVEGREHDFYINGGNCDPDRFELIARAGEPVTFQPGDVVECVTSGSGESASGPGEPGERFTVKEAPCNGSDIRLEGHRLSANPRRFKLVHRPAKPEAGALQKLISVNEIKPGDFVTVRVKVHDVARSFPRIRLVSPLVEAEQIIGHEPAPEEPLAVGDRVEHVNGMTYSEYRVAAIDGQQLALRSITHGGLVVVDAKEWRRVR